MEDLSKKVVYEDEENLRESISKGASSDRMIEGQGEGLGSAPDIVLTREESAEIVREYNILYGLIEGIRSYVLQQDAADGTEALCDGLFYQSTRMLRKLELLKRRLVIS